MSKPFKENTVLVLGAGASKPYNFPLGMELKGHLTGNANEAAINALEAYGRHQKELVAEFQQALRQTAHPTIDIFLEYKKMFREIGAFFIAAAIGQMENDGALFPQKDWYSDLFRFLDFETLQRDVVNISIVTLNYDRSLERFLDRNIDVNCRDELTERCHERRKSLKIVHAHGSIGPYPQVKYGDASRTREGIRGAAEGIKIVSDTLEESPDFMTAQDVLAQAQHVVFLGFGYNNRTLEALLAKVNRENAHFYGTALDVPDPTRGAVSEVFGGKIVLGNHNQSCSSFLKEIGLNN